MLKFLVAVLAMMMLAVPPAGQTQQTYDTEEVKNTKQARAALEAMTIASRNTFLIDPKGKIVKVWTKVDPSHHSEEVLAALAEQKK